MRKKPTPRPDRRDRPFFADHQAFVAATWIFAAKERFERAGVRAVVAEPGNAPAVARMLQRDPAARWCVVSPGFYDWLLRDFTPDDRLKILKRERSRSFRTDEAESRLITTAVNREFALQGFISDEFRRKLLIRAGTIGRAKPLFTRHGGPAALRAAKSAKAAP